MVGQVPSHWELIQVGVATTIGTGLVYDLFIVVGSAYSGAVFQGLAFIPLTIAISAAICVVAVIPAYLLWCFILKGLLAAKAEASVVIYASLALVTLIISLGLGFGMGLLQAPPVGTLFAFGVIPQLCLFAATRVFLVDRNDGKSA